MFNLPVLGASGKLGSSAGYGRAQCGLTRAGDPCYVSGIYQMRLTKKGKRPIRMKFYTPTNPMTVLQQANRTKFATAMSTWGALTPEEKQPYIERAKRRQMKPWGLFVREYYQSH